MCFAGPSMSNSADADQMSPDVASLLNVRAVPAYLKVVRRRKPSSAEGMRGESTRGGLLPLWFGGGGLGGLPRENI